MYTSQQTWLPVLPKGLGQTVCPSAEQAAGILDCSDPCQATSAACLGSSAISPNLLTGQNFQCYNSQTGSYYNCNVSGTATGLTPAGTGPNGVPVVTSSSWVILAAVLGGLVLLSAVVK